MAADGIPLGPQRTTLQPGDGRPADQLGPALPGRSRDNILVFPTTGDPEVTGEAVTEDGTIATFDSSGGVTLSAPAVKSNRDRTDFNENLADQFDDRIVAQVGDDVVQGVEADVLTRTDLIEQYVQGIDLLGTKIEQLTNSRGQKRDVSRANHTLLMEAMVKYHAGAEAELLPAAGPAKVGEASEAGSDEERRAQQFQEVLNYYLTEVAKEYYPDTSRALMQQGYCGSVYKKVYRCPVRQRPVSESVYLPDLIVSDTATDLDSAHRVTHQSEMMRATIRRMQLAGHYRDIDIGQPNGFQWSPNQQAQRKIREAQGLAAVGSFMRPQDMPFTVWESDVMLDVDDLDMIGYYEDRTPAGLPLPYKVTVCPDTRQVLAIRRNWDPRDPLYRKRNMYVKYGMVPSLGFHDWGFLQLLGNQTRTLRAIVRLLITAGMFANFPGGAKNTQARLSTNEMAPGPGEWVDVDVPAGKKLDEQFFPMPYKGPDAVFIQLMEAIQQDAMRLGSTVELEVGEGRTNVPVGTVLAMIEQQTQVMGAVHKRNHRAQKEELHKIRMLFAENPDDQRLLIPASNTRGLELPSEFMDLNLLPASDPNVPAQTHRIMLANVLMMLAKADPELYDVLKVHRSVLRTIGANPDEFLVDPKDRPPQGPPPEAQGIAAELSLKQQKQQSDAANDAAKIDVKRQEVALDQQRLGLDAQKAVAENETQRQQSALHAQTEVAKSRIAAAPTPPAPTGAPQMVGFSGEPMPLP